MWYSGTRVPTNMYKMVTVANPTTSDSSPSSQHLNGLCVVRSGCGLRGGCGGWSLHCGSRRLAGRRSWHRRCQLVSLPWGGQVGLLASLGSMRFTTTLCADSHCHGLVTQGGREVSLGGHWSHSWNEPRPQLRVVGSWGLQTWCGDGIAVNRLSTVVLRGPQLGVRNLGVVLTYARR
jgi:hypothetical protein